MQDNVISNETLKNIANAMKEILPNTEIIKLKDFPAKIKELPEVIKGNYLSYHPLKTITGNSIQLNDVCELPHKIKCEATKNNSNLIVTAAGANLLTGNEDQKKRKFLEYRQFADGGICCSGFVDQTEIFELGPQFLLKEGTYTLSGGNVNYNFILNIYDKTNNLIHSYVNNKKAVTFTLSQKANAQCILIVSPSNISQTIYLKPMLNYGSKALPYEPTIRKDYKINELENISTKYFPYFNIFANDDRTQLTVTYHQSAGIKYMEEQNNV